MFLLPTSLWAVVVVVFKGSWPHTREFHTVGGKWFLAWYLGFSMILGGMGWVRMFLIK